MPAKATKKSPKSTSKNTLPLFPPGPVVSLPQGHSEELPPDSLLLDPGNFRLLEAASASLRETPAKLIGQPSLQEKLLKIISEDPQFDIDRLMASIAYNGFLKHEHLIVARFNDQKHLVLEGNRRLTAVQRLQQKFRSAPESFTPEMRVALINTTKTLPCFILDGPIIDDSDEELAKYRRASEVYVGMRHLMGARNWEPASRYEFQARLIEEGWTPEQVAERFGREKSQILRELKGQRLYSDFVAFERRHKLTHNLTYNAFAEAGRAPQIMNWLEWSAKDMKVTNKENEETFFSYLINRLRGASSHDDNEDQSVEESAEKIIRRLRDIIKLSDPDVLGALSDRHFDEAELLYESKKEGEFAKRLTSYIRGLKRATVSDLRKNPTENQRLLRQLVEEANFLTGLLSKKR